MRHRHGLRKLNRTSSHRLAMFRNMANSLLRHELINTTLPKAKELRRVVEPIITLGKKPSLANRRLAFDRLRDREVVVKVFDELGPRYANRNGGYLRILKRGFRHGDNAPMALVELMDRPDTDEGEAAKDKEEAKEGDRESSCLIRARRSNFESRPGGRLLFFRRTGDAGPFQQKRAGPPAPPVPPSLEGRRSDVLERGCGPLPERSLPASPVPLSLDGHDASEWFRGQVAFYGSSAFIGGLRSCRTFTSSPSPAGKTAPSPRSGARTADGR